MKSEEGKPQLCGVSLETKSQWMIEYIFLMTILEEDKMAFHGKLTHFVKLKFPFETLRFNNRKFHRRAWPRNLLSKQNDWQSIFFFVSKSSYLSGEYEKYRWVKMWEIFSDRNFFGGRRIWLICPVRVKGEPVFYRKSSSRASLRPLKSHS